MAGSTKNFRHGRIRIEDGSTPVALNRIAEFTEGDFSWKINKDLKQILDRGKIAELRRGDEQAVEWSFSAKFCDKTLYQVLDQGIFNGQSELIAGLAGGALNDPVATTYAYVQNTLQVSDPGYTKGAIGSVPAAAGDFSEDLGAVDRDEVVSIGTFQVFQPVADVDLNVTYDAVAFSTREAQFAVCKDDVKTLKIILEIFDPCDPNTIVETYTLNHSAVSEVSFQEGDDFDTISFTGFSIIIRPLVT